MLSFFRCNHSTQQTETQPATWDLLLPCGKQTTLTSRSEWTCLTLWTRHKGNYWGYRTVEWYSHDFSPGSRGMALLAFIFHSLVSGYRQEARGPVLVAMCNWDTDHTATERPAASWRFLLFANEWVNTVIAMKLTERLKRLKPFGSAPPEPPPLLVVPVSQWMGLISLWSSSFYYSNQEEILTSALNELLGLLPPFFLWPSQF